MIASITRKLRRSGPAIRLTEKVSAAQCAISRLRHPPALDEISGELDIAVGMLFMGDRSRLEELVESPSREEAIRTSIVLAERLVTTLTMVAHETDEDLFESWARLCQFVANESLHEEWDL